MCTTAAFDGNKTQVCTVGDLKPGNRYRTPSGAEMMVADLHPMNMVPQIYQFVFVVDTATGILGRERPDTRLGTDRAGRLYASRALNDPKPVAVITNNAEFERLDAAQDPLQDPRP